MPGRQGPGRGVGPAWRQFANSRVGVLGGTFDPVHIGHLILAEEARDQLDLDLVYFVPAGDPPHKRDRRLAPVEARVRMAELAVAGNDAFQVSRVDADRPGPHYTIDMVQHRPEQLPPGGELYFLMGFDSLAELPTWHKPQAGRRLPPGRADSSRHRRGLGESGGHAARHPRARHLAGHARAGDRLASPPGTHASRAAASATWCRIKCAHISERTGSTTRTNDE